MKSINKLSEAAKFLIIAGTILIVCTLVVVGFFVMKEGKDGTNKSLAQFTSITSNHSDIEREKYHNLEISGTSLIDLIQQELEDKEVDIYYETLMKPNTMVKASKDTFDLSKTPRTSDSYINPTGTFKGNVGKNDSGVITKIEFTQIK